MNLQAEQKTIIEDNQSVDSIKPITIQSHPSRRRPSVQGSQPNPQPEPTTEKIIGKNIETDQKSKEQNNKKENVKEPGSPEASQPSIDYYEEHKRFLENYRKERQKQMKDSSAMAMYELPLTEQACQFEEDQIDDKEKISKINTDLIGEKIKKIHLKLKREIINQKQEEDERPKYKIFTDFVENKNDIDRISKEKRFIRSQMSKDLLYEEPSMPSHNQLPPQYRIKTQSFQDEANLGKRARQFVQRIQKQQENLMGRHVIRKKKEQNRKFIEEKQQLKRIEQLNEFKKMERKLKAQQNLMLLKQKAKINQLVNRSSLEELKHILEEKEKKLQEIRMSLKLKPDPNRKEHKKQLLHHNKRTRLSVPEDGYFEIPRSNSTKTNQARIFPNKKTLNKDTERSLRQKFVLKRYRKTRPTEYVQDSSEVENEFLDKQIKLNPGNIKAVTKSNEVSSIPRRYPSDIGDSIQETEFKKKPMLNRNHTQYVIAEEGTFGMKRARLQADKKQKSII